MTDVTTSPVVLVTGAAKRIGRQIALTMAERGWDVVVHYGQSQQEAQEVVAQIVAMGRRAMDLQAELGDETQVRMMVPQIVQQMGSLRCVVNNASLFEADTALDFSGACLDKHMHANLMAPVLLAQALYAAQAEDAPAGLASVVNILDQKLANLNPDYMSYTLSKAALQTATTTLAQALAPRVRVVGIAPGLSLVSGAQTEEEFERAHSLTPLGQASTALEVAEAVAYVAQARAITGTTLLVDGGQHLLPSHRDVMFLTQGKSAK
ncbi:MAG: SDR family oxidoreductase [Burkholderiales bacterium]|nr:SDR family oxidoreductase [Burkholderiales bacterium]